MPGQNDLVVGGGPNNASAVSKTALKPNRIGHVKGWLTKIAVHWAKKKDPAMINQSRVPERGSGLGG